MYTFHAALYSAGTISERVGGTLYGNPDRTIVGLCSRDYPIADHITFLRVKSARALEGGIRALEGAVALVPAALLSSDTELGVATAIAVPDPYAAFLDLIPLFFEEQRPTAGIHPTAVIAPSAEIDPSASIGAHCTVGAAAVVGAHAVLHATVTVYPHARIGSYSVLHSGVVIREHSTLGDRCIVHNNSVIGADGFGYIPDPRRGLRKVPQLGAVEIADDVEIGANTCIDRGALGNTRIGRGTKIDNLVQIGHNVSIGSHCIICGQVGIAGSTTIEDGVILGGQSGIADHLRLAAGVRVGGGASVTHDLLEPGDYMGFPIMRAGDWRRFSVEIRNRRGARKI